MINSKHNVAVEVEKYANKVLGIRNYASEKEEFGVTDFLDLDVLYDFIWEVADGESDFTPAGVIFIRKCLDMHEIANEYRRRGRQLPPHGKAKNDQERITYFLEYVNAVEPMEMALILANHQAKEDGSNTGYTLADLRDELQPPAPAND